MSIGGIRVGPKMGAFVLLAVLGVLALLFTGGEGAMAGTQTVNRLELIAGDLAANDYFGDSVDTDGNWTIIGAPNKASYATGSGAVYVSAFTGTRWTSPAALVPGDTAWTDYEWARFGAAVAVDGEWAVVGAPGMDSGGTENVGAAYVFRRQGGQWQDSTNLTGPWTTYAAFGEAVAVDGDTIAGAAPEMDEAAPGRVYVFRWNGSWWSGEGYVTASDSWDGDYFGREISLSGNTLVVGHEYDGNGDAHVFTRSGSTWTERTTLEHTDPGGSDRFGASVAVDGGTIAVGAPNVYSQRGEVFVFNGSGASWSPDAVLLAPNRAAGDYFGESVAIDDGTIAVGAPYYDGTNTDSGALWAFGGAGSSWVAYPAVYGQYEGDYFWGIEYENQTYNGAAVSVAGEHLVSGAPRDGMDPLWGERTGSVHTAKLVAGSDPKTYKDRGVSITFGTITVPGYDDDYNDVNSLSGFQATPRFESANGYPTGYTVTDQTLFDLETNVTFAGSFVVTIPYHQDNVPNWLNTQGPVAEADLKMLHFDGEEWVDVTTSVDTNANTVSGTASSFSEFVIVETGEATSNPYYNWDTTANAGSLQTPHKDYRLTTRKCQVCHVVHNANPDGELLLPTTRANACTYCHITTTLGGIVIYGGNPDNYLVEDDYGHQAAGGVICTDCHAVHGANTMGGDQGIETKILHAGGYQAELVSIVATGDADAITTGGAPGAQVWGNHRWDELELQRTAFCTRCHQYYSHTSTQTVNGFNFHPLRDYYDPGGTIPDTPDRFGLGIAVADHTTRGCTWFCHEGYDPDLGTQLVNLGVGIHDGSLPHYTPKHIKFLMADGIPAVDSTTDDVCFECHLWDPGVEGVGETF